MEHRIIVNVTTNDTRNDITVTGDRSNYDTTNEENIEVEKPVEKESKNITTDETKIHHRVRRSSRNRKQRMKINHDEIGDCDDKNDHNYK